MKMFKSAILASGVMTSLGLTMYYLFFRKRKSIQKYFPQLILYKYPHFRSNRCIWLITELGIRERVTEREINTMEKNSAEMQDYMRYIHPHGTVPALVLDEATIILESGAICLYLADICGRLLPRDRKRYYNWILYCCSTVDEILEILFVQWNFIPVEKQDKVAIDSAIRKFKVFAEYLEEQLVGRDFICGEKFTAADCVLAYDIWWASVMQNGILLRGYHNIENYFFRIRERPAFNSVFYSN